MEEDSEREIREVPRDQPRPWLDKMDEGLTMQRCPIHGVPYPRGGSCPICDRDQQG